MEDPIVGSQLLSQVDSLTALGALVRPCPRGLCGVLLRVRGPIQHSAMVRVRNIALNMLQMSVLNFIHVKFELGELYLCYDTRRTRATLTGVRHRGKVVKKEV